MTTIKKLIGAFFAITVAVLLIGIVSADTDSIAFHIGETEVGPDSFDFIDQNISIGVTTTLYSGTPDQGIASVYIDGIFNKNKTIFYDAGTYSTSAGAPLDVEALSVVKTDVIKFIVYIDNTNILTKEVTVNPAAPTFSNFVVSEDNPIQDENTTFSIDVTDPSGVDEDSVVAHISVPEGCAALTETDKELTKKEGTDSTYEYVDYNLENACVYSFNFTASDTYGTEGNSAGHSVEAHAKVADTLNEMVSNLFELADDELDFVLSCDSEGPYAESVGYTFDLDQDTYGIHDIQLSFSNVTDTETIEASTVSTDGSGLDSAKGLNYISSIKDGFEIKIASAPNGKACFLGDSEPVEKDTILYCGEDTLTDCDGNWILEEIELDTGCMQSARSIGSFFVLATCANDYWYDGECNDALEGSDGSSGSDSSSDSTKKETKKTTTKTTSTNTNSDSDETIGADNTTSGESLTGLGTFLSENTGTAVSIGVIGLLVAGLATFVVMRVRKRKKDGSSANKDDKKPDDKSRPSIHSLAKQHEVHKMPKDPKDEKKIKEFIEVAMMMGHDAHDLRDALKYRGWDSSTVNRVLKGTSFKDAK